MDEELEIFLEDCDDQLSIMEASLLEMQEKGSCEENIGSVFRAMHTIKGSAGMFGFNNIVAFTHIGENLFELIRQGTIEVTEDMTDMFLLCRDHVEKLINAEATATDLDAEEKAIGQELSEKLNTYIEFKEVESKEISLSDVEVKKDVVELPQWHISIRFKESFFTTGMSIHAIFNFLNFTGNIIQNIPITYNIPLLKDIDPLSTYIGFELIYATDISYAEILEVFEFVEHDIDLIVFNASDHTQLETLISKRQEKGLKAQLIEFSFCKEDECKKIEIQEVKKEEVLEAKETLVKKPSASLRVDSNKIDLLINYMSEIVIANSKIITLVDKEDNIELEEAAVLMRELLEYVRDGIMNIRMVQVGDSFNKFKRIVNDTSKKIGKDVEFVISGGETELDKTVVERISDPILHMLRNSIDHGIELPEERVAKGKESRGRVDLRAYPDSGTIVIEIEDNGKGLDKDRILAKAIENGQVSPNATLSDEEIYKLVFAAGLSTAESVSDISGRGVGMDVVKRNIEELRGTIDIDSTLGKGSKITIRLPLTLAVIDGFLVKVGETKYIIPLESIQECIELTKEDEDKMQGNEFINLRGEMLPLMDVRTVLSEKPSLSKRQNIVIVHFGAKMVGLLVDELLGEHQTVIKPLGDVFTNVLGISGGSILGSGEIALIFDIARLIEYKGNS